MRIIIETIPHKDQRYPTCGDWYFEPDGTLRIRSSEEVGVKSAGLVAIHELIEVFLCSHGFSLSRSEQEELVRIVDDFDKKFRGDLVEEEPGDDPKAPYHREHSISTAVERLLCAELQIPWKEHDDAVAKLFE